MSVKHCEVREDDVAIACGPYKDPMSNPDWQGDRFTFIFHKGAQKQIMKEINDRNKPNCVKLLDGFDPKNLPANFNEIVAEFLQEKFPPK